MGRSKVENRLKVRIDFLKQLEGLSKDIVVYGIGNAVSMCIGIFTAPILTRIFVPSDYGVIALLQTTINFLLMFAGFNLISGVYRYYFEYDDQEKKQEIISTSLFCFLIIGVLFAAGTWLAAPILEKLLHIRKTGAAEIGAYEYAKYLRILAIGMPFSILSTYFKSLLRMMRLPYKYMILNLVHIFSNISLVVLLVVYLRTGIAGALWAGVIASMLVCVIGFLLTFKNYLLVFSLSFLSLFLGYSLPQLPAVFLNWGLRQSNRFFLNYYCLLDQQGYYAIALRIASIFLLFATAFRLAWDPFAMSIMKEKDAKQKYADIFSFYMICLGLAASLLGIFAKPILMILTPEKYHIAYSIVFIIVLAYLMQGANNILGIGIGISKKTKYLSYAQCIAFIVNMGLNFLLIPSFKAWGAALAFAGGAIAQSFAYYYFAQRVYPTPYRFWQQQVFLFTIMIVVSGQTVLVKDFGIMGTILWGVAFVPVLFLIALWLGFSNEEKGKILGGLPIKRFQSKYSSYPKQL